MIEADGTAAAARVAGSLPVQSEVKRSLRILASNNVHTPCDHIHFI
jgi:hypothetical protein